MTVPEKTVTKNTVSPVSYPALIRRLHSWEEAVSMGVQFVYEYDQARWKLGALASFVRTSSLVGGRPRKGNEAGTVSRLADAIGIRRESLSAYCWDYEFYSNVQDKLPDNATSRIYSQARRDSKWRPGMEITQEFQAKAISLIEQAVDGDRPHPAPPSIADVLADCYDYLKRQADRYDYAAPALSTAIYDLDAARAGLMKEATP